MKKLDKIIRKPLALEVENWICRYIITNGIKPGDALPGELALAAMMDISRTVVREALSGLRRIGLIESKKKRGIVVKAVDPTEIFETCLPFFPSGPNKLEDLFYLRYVLETGAVELAVRRGTEESIKEIKKAAEYNSNQVKKGAAGEELEAADMAFHMAILRATGNSFLLKMSDVIIRYFEGYYEALSRKAIALSRTRLKRSVDQHEMIAEAIKKRDIETATDLMKKHFRDLMKELKIK